MKNLALLADVAAVPSAYDAEALVSVLVGYLIQAGIPEPGLTRMMLDVIDELRRRDAGHSYAALRALAVIGPPGVAEYAAVAAGRLAARDAALPWAASIGEVTAGTCHLAANAAGDTTLVSCEFTYADGSKPHAVWAVLDAAWHGVPACLMLADDRLPSRRRRRRASVDRGAENLLLVVADDQQRIRPGCRQRTAQRAGHSSTGMNMTGACEDARPRTSITHPGRRVRSRRSGSR